MTRYGVRAAGEVWVGRQAGQRRGGTGMKCATAGRAIYPAPDRHQAAGRL